MNTSTFRSLAIRLLAQGRRAFFLGGDAILLIAAIVAAVTLRFEGRVPAAVWTQMPLVIVLCLSVKLTAFASQGMYALSWAQAGLDDILAVIRGVTFGSLLFWMAVFLLKTFGVLPGFSRSVLLIDYILTLNAIGAFRMGRRVYLHLSRRTPHGGRRALIVGAGAAGEQLVRSLRLTPTSGYTVEGFIDDDPRKHGMLIQGMRVLGDRQRLLGVAQTHGIEAILIAMPSAGSRIIRNVVNLAREAGVGEIRIVPSLDRILDGRLSFTDLREVQLADLLGRELVDIDTVEVRRWLQGRTVLVTGAGGSIGSELCRQIAQFHPRELVLLDRDETNLFSVEQEMRRMEQRAVASLADVCDAARVREVFHRHRPQVVFHAAAYKHVGLMERHPEMAVSTNVLGTLEVAEASIAVGVEKFVLISTDKAVSPTSIMGVTKRVAEQIGLALHGQGLTRFTAVRFGNVLGSRGSVIPLFQENIRRGEPLVVRGPQMRRYFMAVSEAVLLVLQAGVMGQGGEVFVLDMGEPVRIIDLAREMIRLSQLEPEKDVPIIFADPEPGEKEFEDLLTTEEGTVATRHDRIFVSSGSLHLPPEATLALVQTLRDMLDRRDIDSTLQTLQTLVPSYQMSELLKQQIRPNT